MSLKRLLVVSLGNPGKLADTYHSIGHIAIKALQKQLPENSLFATQRYAKHSGVSISQGPKYCLLTSPTLMNISGPFVAAAYKEYVKEQNLAPEEVGLVVVHDELEEKLGVVKTRMWQSSPRGHNGVKSVQKSLPHRPDRSWARVTVGIGRPLERSKTTVSDFVLGKVPHDAKTVIEREASARLLEMLTQLERKWEAAAAAA